MYAEFIGIYIGLGILFLLGIANLILVLFSIKKTDKPTYMGNSMIQSQPTNAYPTQANTVNPAVNTAVPSGNVVFCKKCAAEFDATARCCPKCGTPR